MKNILTSLATVILHEKNKNNAAGILFYMPIRRNDERENILERRLHFFSSVDVNNFESVPTHSI